MNWSKESIERVLDGVVETVDLEGLTWSDVQRIVEAQTEAVWKLYEESTTEQFGVHHDGNPPEWATEVQSRKAAEQLGRIMSGYRIETSPVSRRVTQWSRIKGEA